MNMLSNLKGASIGGGLSLSLIAASIIVLATAAGQAVAQESVDNLTNVTRGFSYSDSPGSDNNDRYEFYMKGDPSLERYKEYMRRDSMNFITGVASGDRPPFTSLVESIATVGAREKIQKDWGIRGEAPNNRAINQQFKQRLIRGTPQMIDAYGLDGGKTFVGPVHKRAIFLQRIGDGLPSHSTVDSELSEYAESIAKKVEAISDRVMLYSMDGHPRNWPTASFPADTIVKRKFDAVIMIWPKKDRMLPMDFPGVPANYRVLYGVNMQGYYYAAPGPKK